MEDPIIVLEIPTTFRQHTKVEWPALGVSDGVVAGETFIVNEEKLDFGNYWKTAHVYYDDECYITVDYLFSIFHNERGILYDITDFEVDFEPDDLVGIIDVFWDFGDGTTSSEYFPTHIYNQNGTYEVSLTIENGCGVWTSTETITIGQVTSFQEIVELEFALSPNPTSTLVEVITNEAIEDIVIYDMNGKIVKEIQNQGVSKTIDVTELPMGIYLVRIKVDDNRYGTKKLLKIR